MSALYLKVVEVTAIILTEAVENIREAIEVCIEEDNVEDRPTFIGIRDIELATA